MFAATSAFYDRLDGVRELLIDPARTSVRLVVNPERMVIAEARRTYTYLSLFGYRVDAVDRQPAAARTRWPTRGSSGGRSSTSSTSRRSRTASPRCPCSPWSWRAEELVGVDALRGFGARVYGERDAASILHEGQPLQITRSDGRTTLVARAAVRRPRRPRARAAAATSCSCGSVRTGGPSRCPTRSGNRPVADASLKQGRLRVIFEGSADDG